MYSDHLEKLLIVYPMAPFHVTRKILVVNQFHCVFYIDAGTDHWNICGQVSQKTDC